MDEDTQHLKLLSIFHYVLGGLSGLFALLPLIHLGMGVMMATGGFGDATTPEEAETMRLVGGVISAFAGLFVLLGLAFAACVVATGRFLATRTRYTFCLVMGGIECAFMPLGTVLGIFTLLVLLRDSVKARFGAAPAPPPATA